VVSSAQKALTSPVQLKVGLQTLTMQSETVLAHGSLTGHCYGKSEDNSSAYTKRYIAEKCFNSSRCL